MSQRSATYFAVLQERGENWDARLPLRQQEQWDEHAAFMDALAEDGFVILGGPLGEMAAHLREDHVADAEADVGMGVVDGVIDHARPPGRPT